MPAYTDPASLLTQAQRDEIHRIVNDILAKNDLFSTNQKPPFDCSIQTSIRSISRPVISPISPPFSPVLPSVSTSLSPPLSTSLSPSLSPLSSPSLSPVSTSLSPPIVPERLPPLIHDQAFVVGPRRFPYSLLRLAYVRLARLSFPLFLSCLPAAYSRQAHYTKSLIGSARRNLRVCKRWVWDPGVHKN